MFAFFGKLFRSRRAAAPSAMPPPPRAASIPSSHRSGAPMSSTASIAVSAATRSRRPKSRSGTDPAGHAQPCQWRCAKPAPARHDLSRGSGNRRKRDAAGTLTRAKRAAGSSGRSSRHPCSHRARCRRHEPASPRARSRDPSPSRPDGRNRQKAGTDSRAPWAACPARHPPPRSAAASRFPPRGSSGDARRPAMRSARDCAARGRADRDRRQR